MQCQNPNGTESFIHFLLEWELEHTAVNSPGRIHSKHHIYIGDVTLIIYPVYITVGHSYS